MAERNDGVIDAALKAVVQAVQNNQNGGNDEFCNLGKFQRKHPPTFKGRYDPDGAQTWLKKIENIFRALDCPEV